MGIFDKFHIQNRKDQFPRRIKELKQATPIAGEVKVPDFIEHVTEQLRNEIDIDPDVYVKNNVKRGLRNANGTGVVVGLTRVGSAVGYKLGENGEKIIQEGKLYYRGYDIEDLVRGVIKDNRRGFEEITYLLLSGTLPTESELNKFKDMLAAKRQLPNRIIKDILMTTPPRDLMTKLAINVLQLYTYDKQADDVSIENVVRQSVDIIGYFPALMAYAYQMKCAYYDNKGLMLHYPIPEFGAAENILRLIRTSGEYTDIEATILDLCLILHAEHGGGNNSTFTTHLVSSTATDTYSAIAASIGSLKGPKHGGANIKVIDMIADLKRNVRDITNEKQIKKYITDVLKGKANDGSGLVYGVGHAIYTLSDPRAKLLKEMARKLAESKNKLDEFHIYEVIEENTQSLYEKVHGRNVVMSANVDLYSGFVYKALDIPNELATPIVATARVSGWCAHRLEELAFNKKIIRPAYKNIKPKEEYIPMTER